MFRPQFGVRIPLLKLASWTFGVTSAEMYLSIANQILMTASTTLRFHEIILQNPDFFQKKVGILTRKNSATKCWKKGWYLLYVAKVAVGSHNLFKCMKGNPITLHYPKICYCAKRGPKVSLFSKDGVILLRQPFRLPAPVRKFRWWKGEFQSKSFRKLLGEASHLVSG